MIYFFGFVGCVIGYYLYRLLPDKLYKGTQSQENEYVREVGDRVISTSLTSMSHEWYVKTRKRKSGKQRKEKTYIGCTHDIMDLETGGIRTVINWDCSDCPICNEEEEE